MTPTIHYSNDYVIGSPPAARACLRQGRCLLIFSLSSLHDEFAAQYTKPVMSGSRYRRFHGSDEWFTSSKVSWKCCMEVILTSMNFHGSHESGVPPGFHGSRDGASVNFHALPWK